MNNKKISIGIIALLLVITLAPQVTFASWWNPFSWFKKTPKVEQVNIPVLDAKKTITAEEKIDTSTQKKPEVKKTTPSTDNSATSNVKVKAKIDAELKAKAEQDILISKQKAEQDALIIKRKADEQAKEEIKKEVDRIMNERYLAEQRAKEKIQNENDEKMRQFNQKLSDLTQQISDIKTQYNIDMENAIKTFGPFANLNEPAKKLLLEANAKIDQINTQIQKLYLEYNQKPILINPLPANYCSVSKPCSGSASA